SNRFFLLASVVVFVAGLVHVHSQSQSGRKQVANSFEYASARFMEQRTTIFWPDGTVQNVMDTKGKKKFPGGEYYPKNTDYRMYWLTVAINMMSQRGYELVHMKDNDVLMKRLAGR
ncbi:MAG: hypothetical protein ACPGVU_25555, partial [Limisphaerales bacterium]